MKKELNVENLVVLKARNYSSSSGDDSEKNKIKNLPSYKPDEAQIEEHRGSESTAITNRILAEKHFMVTKSTRRTRIKDPKEEALYKALLDAEGDTGADESIAGISGADEERFRDMKRRAKRDIPEPQYVMPSDLSRDSIYRLYVETELIEDIQMSRVFKDSKTFVDKMLKYPISEIFGKYKRYKDENSRKKKRVLSRDRIQKFVLDNFEDFEDLQPWQPGDWDPNPRFLQEIKNPELKNFGKELNQIWLKLSRKLSEEISQEPNKTSGVYVPNGLIIPGGRFKEVYYWDTYWIVKGLLICGMHNTARGLIENLIYLVRQYGHIPNGTRKYYIGRSQPPLLIMMVEEYYKRTNDFNFIKENIRFLDAEMNFWFNTRRVKVYSRDKSYIVYRYYAATPIPRPESYREDKISASFENSEMSRKFRYLCLRSAAESGWDFSTRWFIFKGQNMGTIIDCATIFIVPVDLNAFMHYNYRLLSEWHSRLGNKSHSDVYKERTSYLQIVLDELLWSEERGVWLDYDAMHEKPRDYMYLSNFVPLWTQSYKKDPEKMLVQIGHYIDLLNFDRYRGGFPTSIYSTTEQWDFPNSWAPLQAILYQGLERLGIPTASGMAKDYALMWLNSNYEGYRKFKSMFEKYDCINIGEIGGSGEYRAQEGFGWTNGVVLEILEAYGSSIDLIESPKLISFYEAVHGKERTTESSLKEEPYRRTRMARQRDRKYKQGIKDERKEITEDRSK